MALLVVTLGLEQGALSLTQVRYSQTVQALINSLPRKSWNGKSWIIPPADLGIVRERFAGIKLLEADSVRKLPDPRDRAPLVKQPPREPAPTLPELKGYTFKTKPFDHQRKAFTLAASKRWFALLMEMGTGKTKVTIDVLSYLKQRGRIEGALILCPKAVLWNWAREIETHSPLTKDKRRTVVITGTAEEKLQAIQRGANTCQFFITNYETLLRFEDQLTALLKRGKFAMVLDESTEIKSHKAKQTKASWRIGLHAEARYIMTGSPITQSPLDAFAQFKFLSPNILGHHNFQAFAKEYAITGGFKGKQFVGFINLDRMAKKIQPWSFRVLKKDCLDLPEKIYRTVELRMGPKQKQAYEQMRDEAIVDLQGSQVKAPIVLTKMLRLAQITSGYLPRLDEFGKEVGRIEFEDAPKIPAAVEIARQAIESGQKLIIWCRFIPDIERLADALARAGLLGFERYTGSTSDVERQAIVDRFQKIDKCNIFLGQIQTGGMAITLTAATHVVYYSNTFSLADRLQSEDRAHRIGQTRSVEYDDLVCKGTIDRLIIKALREKKDFADIVTGDREWLIKELRSDGDDQWG